MTHDEKVLIGKRILSRFEECGWSLWLEHTRRGQAYVVIAPEPESEAFAELKASEYWGCVKAALIAERRFERASKLFATVAEVAEDELLRVARGIVTSAALREFADAE